MSKLNTLAGNEARHNLQKWISPPDLSGNYDAACDSHHEGTVAWCTQGDTFNRWSESGSLLWIHGKRIYVLQASVSLSLLTTSWYYSWLWEECS
jgi:hypothetical protein